MATVLTEFDSGIGIVTLNRPDRRNAFDDEVIAALSDAFEEVASDPEVRVLVLSAAGESFCAGADLEWMKRAADYTESESLRDATQFAALLNTLHELPKPSVARVQGPAYDVGVGLIAACDIAVATFDAHFALSEVKLGLIPAIVSPYVIAAIGARSARRFMLSGERFSAAQAYRMGLLHEIVPDEGALDEAVGEIVDALLACGPDAQAACKSLIAAVAKRPIDDAVIEETALRLTAVRASDEGREGMAAFLEKRDPAWMTGR